MLPAARDLRNAPTRAAVNIGASNLGKAAEIGLRIATAFDPRHNRVTGASPVISCPRSGSAALVEIFRIVQNVFRGTQVAESEVSQHDEFVWRSGQDA